MALSNRSAFSSATFLSVAFLWAGHESPVQAGALDFTPGDLVVSVEGDGSGTGSYLDNQAAPLTLMQFTTSGAAAGSMMLPTVASGSNVAISGEYGSSSEGTLQLSGNGQYLTLMGYGVNPTTYNSTFDVNGTGTALGQSFSSAVPRVVALIAANGSVDTSTALTNVFDQNNPRSVYTVNGTSFYVSGQGASGDATGGVFYTTLGSTTAVSITGADAGSGAAQDTREVQIVNNTLYVSVDSKSGSNNRDFIGTLGTPPATSLFNSGNGPTQLNGFGTSNAGKLTITTGVNGDGNGLNAGAKINLSPENYFFANATTLYVADSGDPKNNSNCSGSNCVSVGDGGLQKWTLSGGSWVLDYTLATGLHLVNNNNGATTSGTSGLYGLTGKVVGNNVELFATSFALGDTDQTYLYGVMDSLSATTASQVSSEAFAQLAMAPPDSNFKGVAFAPVPLPPTLPLMLSGALLLGLAAARKSDLLRV